jgi:hypothetical protein
MTPDKPLLTGWMMLSDVKRRELFATTEHLAAAELFAQRADDFQNPKTGNFTFLIARDLKLVMSATSVQAALHYHPQTAQALTQAITLPVGSRKHQAAITTLINLIHHLSPKVKNCRRMAFV